MTTARLISVDGYGDIHLDRARLLLVGSHPTCDVRIESTGVSRFHCCVSRVEDRVLIRDLESTNGTRINGRRVTWGCLRAGDELAIAHLCYRVRFEEADASEALPSVIPAGATIGWEKHPQGMSPRAWRSA
jgi:predicted component of type VI protein secretion system